MAKKLVKIIPQARIQYEAIVNLYKNRDAIYRIFCAPIMPFEALLVKGSLKEEDRLEDDSYRKTSDGYEYVTISEKRLLKFNHMRDDGCFVFSVSRSNYVLEPDDNAYRSNYYKCEENELCYRSSLFCATFFAEEEKKYYAEIIVSPEEYNKYFVACDDIFFLSYIYEGLFGKKKMTRTKYDFTKILGKKHKDFEGLFTYCIAVPLAKLYAQFDSEVLRSYIHSVKDTLDDFVKIDDNVSKERYENLLWQIRDYLMSLVYSAETIPNAKLEDKVVTATMLIEENKIRDSVTGDAHKKNEDGSWGEDSTDSLLKKLGFRKELLTKYWSA